MIGPRIRCCKRVWHSSCMMNKMRQIPKILRRWKNLSYTHVCVFSVCVLTRRKFWSRFVKSSFPCMMECSMYDAENTLGNVIKNSCAMTQRVTWYYVVRVFERFIRRREYGSFNLKYFDEVVTWCLFKCLRNLFPLSREWCYIIMSV